MTIYTYRDNLEQSQTKVHCHEFLKQEFGCVREVNLTDPRCVATRAALEDGVLEFCDCLKAAKIANV